MSGVAYIKKSGTIGGLLANKPLLYMYFFRFLPAALAALFIIGASVPALALAQVAPYSQVVVTTQLAQGVAAPLVLPSITATANGPSFTGVPNTTTTTLSWTASALNEVRTITFIPGNYAVVASVPNYYLAYSQDCAGTTAVGAGTRSCTITLTNTPPATNPCTTWYGSAYNCTTPAPYAGPWYPSQLSCSPAYQTVQAGQPVTFAASGSGGGYNWTTADRTFLNVGPTLSTILQTIGMQTVIVQNGVQTATCTVNIQAAGAGVIQYPGNTPTLVSNFVPALPNTGFEPLSGSALAFAAAALMAAGIYFYPYVKKALAVATR